MYVILKEYGGLHFILKAVSSPTNHQEVPALMLTRVRRASHLEKVANLEPKRVHSPPNYYGITVRAFVQVSGMYCTKYSV